MIRTHLKALLLLFVASFFSFSAHAQIFYDANTPFSRIDSLRGTITAERAWWDILHYNLRVKVEPEQKFIKGTNILQYKVLQAYQPSAPSSLSLNKNTSALLQIELQSPMSISKVMQNGQDLEWMQEEMVYFILLQDPQPLNSIQTLEVHFEGNPKQAVRAPWDGGFSWEKDELGKWFIATSNQGEGASLWWPNKDHPADEPDSLDLHIEVPSDLVAVGNGLLVAKNSDKNTTTYHWKVTNPINNYGVNINIGNYVHYEEEYAGEKGALACHYWVLEQNLDKAKKQFEQVPMMLDAFEYWFGPYPFYEDSFKLVEIPYLGMEHQSSVTYGNGYQNGYLGRDLSRTGEGLKFDFIIIHEAGHEWFANNITNADVADMWIHEGFTNYSESLYLEYHFGKESAWKYIRGLRSNIANKTPIIGPYDVRKEGSSDMYYKGNNMLHTIRMIADSDSLWRGMLCELNASFRHQTVSSQQVEEFMAEYLQLDLKLIFDQYLRDIRIPTFAWRLHENGLLEYKWENAIDDFNMPLDIYVGEERIRLEPTTSWKQLTLSNNLPIQLDKNWYIGSMNLSP